MSTTDMIDAAEAGRRFEAEMRGARSTRMLDSGDAGIGLRVPPGRPVDDHLSASGALALAARIRKFWQGQGHSVEITVEQFATEYGAGFGVRSNLHNGKPTL
jgi:hypothetical protein